MLRFGLPDKILHDQGGEFENDLFKELAKLCGVKRIRTTPYHPPNQWKSGTHEPNYYFHAANITRYCHKYYQYDIVVSVVLDLSYRD